MMTAEVAQRFEDCRRMMRDTLADTTLALQLTMLGAWAPRVLDRGDARLGDLVRDAACWPVIEADLTWMQLDPDSRMAAPAKDLLATLKALRAEQP
jgi:hypothetical protein